MFTAVYQKSGDWWAACVEEVPGVNTQGATLDEARENLREALAMVLEANRELARRDEAPDCIRETMALPSIEDVPQRPPSVECRF
jgi:predicted RNase H-like HicB family nuclease